jgi:CRP-like cAMP-binding protein
MTNPLPTTDYLKATQPTWVYTLTKMEFMAALSAIPSLQTFYQQMILTTLLTCQQRIRDLLSLDAKTYYQQLQHQNPQLLQNMTQQDLAAYLGIEPQSLSRLRKPPK